MRCRHCGSELKLLTKEKLYAPERWFPLRMLVCESCWLVQTEDFTEADKLFDADYAYFSGFSKSWLSHCERYVLEMIDRFDLNQDSYVVEVGANDGCLLQYFRNHSIPCLGIEPTASTAVTARLKAIPIVEEFFGSVLAKKLLDQGKCADLIVANNVLAHVPNINDFVTGFAILLKPQGVATFEFPHLVKLIAGSQFDTIYHEHFSYLSLTAANQIFNANGLSIFDVEEQPTHGGSLRVFTQRQDSGKYSINTNVTKLLAQELQIGICETNYYTNFQRKVNQIKNNFLTFLLEAQRQQKIVVGYGAAAKANTLMNYAGVRPDLIPFVVHCSLVKQGKFMSGSQTPIVDESYIENTKSSYSLFVDYRVQLESLPSVYGQLSYTPKSLKRLYVVVFPWNLKKEILAQPEYVRDWGGSFVVAIFQLEVL
ncbi:class I SAM-dependent methyltransferase [Gloeomargaritales cyanobacterium VI4D9]|nr:class I SAM-dependent methyltransferase [Gloeomargaritales cyanobacterium VI4D9]